MKEIKYVITDPEGIHARPANLLVKKAAGYACKITIGKDGREVDAKRIMGVMSLAAKKGQEITIKCDGEGEESAIVELEAFLKENL